jgi:hypothetical protein
VSWLAAGHLTVPVHSETVLVSQVPESEVLFVATLRGAWAINRSIPRVSLRFTLGYSRAAPAGRKLWSHSSGAPAPGAHGIGAGMRMAV